MINSRDSANTWNPNKKEQIEVPFSVGTVVELKEDPNVLAEILEYRITKKVEYRITKKGIKAGLRYKTEVRYIPYNSRANKIFISSHFSNTVDIEIEIKELEEKWQKIKQTTITIPEEKDRIRINIDLPDDSPYFEGTYTPVFEETAEEARKHLIRIGVLNEDGTRKEIDPTDENLLSFLRGYGVEDVDQYLEEIEITEDKTITQKNESEKSNTENKKEYMKKLVRNKD